MKKLVILVILIIMAMPIFAYAGEHDPVPLGQPWPYNNPANLGCVDTDGGDNPSIPGEITTIAGDLLQKDAKETYYAVDRTTVLYYAVREYFCEKNPQTGQSTGRAMQHMYRCPGAVIVNKHGQAACALFARKPSSPKQPPVPLK
jgi:hypothetical protein